jgi:hypothetical protein
MNIGKQFLRKFAENFRNGDLQAAGFEASLSKLFQGGPRKMLLILHSKFKIKHFAFHLTSLLPR